MLSLCDSQVMSCLILAKGQHFPKPCGNVVFLAVHSSVHPHSTDTATEAPDCLPQTYLLFNYSLERFGTSIAGAGLLLW